jgi:hypothetical protein
VLDPAGWDVDELEGFLRGDRRHRDSFELEARPAASARDAVASIAFRRTPRYKTYLEVDGVRRPITLLDPRLAGRLSADIKGRGLRVNEAELSQLGWELTVARTSEASGQSYKLWSREPAPDDPALLAADVRALAASLIGEEADIEVPMASWMARAKLARHEAREVSRFTFGFFAFAVMPVSAVAAAVLGMAIGWATPLEAAVAIGLTLLFVGLLVVGDNRNSFAGLLHKVGGLLYKVVVGSTSEVVAWLAPVPVVGMLAPGIGMSLVLWFPIVLLAAVAVIL